MKTIKKVNLIGLGLLCPLFAYAASEAVSQAPAGTSATPPATTTTPGEAPKVTQIPKDQWLQKIKEVVSEPICKGFMEDSSISARLKEQKITLEKCVTLIPPIAEKCEKKYYDSVPAMITEENAGTWGRKIGECIGADFAMSYLYPGSGTAAPSADQKTSESSTSTSTSSSTESAPAPASAAPAH